MWKRMKNKDKSWDKRSQGLEANGRDCALNSLADPAISRWGRLVGDLRSQWTAPKRTSPDFKMAS